MDSPCRDRPLQFLRASVCSSNCLPASCQRFRRGACPRLFRSITCMKCRVQFQSSGILISFAFSRISRVRVGMYTSNRLLLQTCLKPCHSQRKLPPSSPSVRLTSRKCGFLGTGRDGLVETGLQRSAAAPNRCAVGVPLSLVSTSSWRISGSPRIRPNPRALSPVWPVIKNSLSLNSGNLSYESAHSARNLGDPS